MTPRLSPPSKKKKEAKTQVEVTSKDYCRLMKTRYPELMNLVRFYFLWYASWLSRTSILFFSILNPSGWTQWRCVCVCVCVCVVAVVHGLTATTSIVYWYGRRQSLYTDCYNKVPRLGGLKNRNSLPHSSGGCKWKKSRYEECWYFLRAQWKRSAPDCSL